ncbi:MAG: TonB-dependent receptor [Desulfobacterales bacterium]|nr:TonB-dependent receptor [Desulfobacterales bacterium]
MKNFRMIFIAVLLSVFCLSSNVFAEKNAETEELDISLGELLNLEKFLVTATKHRMSVRKAPAIATVVTAEEIRNMGARDILDVLRKVPGIVVHRNGGFGFNLYVRGILSGNSGKILFLVDGHRINEHMYGGWSMFTADSLLAENIKRVEVIRGPGSALYGTYAFIGVINVITKTADEIGGQQVSVSYGSFDTQHYNALFSNTDGKFQISGHLDYYETDGMEMLIEEDSQTIFDQMNSTDVSLAPGYTKPSEKKYDLGLKIKYNNLNLNTRIISKEETPIIGNTACLNKRGNFDISQYWGNITYEGKPTDNLDFTAKLYGNHYTHEVLYQMRPEGYTGNPDEGMLARPQFKQNTFGGEMTANCYLDNHLITAGFNLEKIRQYDLKNFHNFIDPASDFIDMTEIENWNTDVDRDIWAVYLQYIWTITGKDSLTLGVRHDNYDDFGGTTNPRIGYVHEFSNDLVMKILYGSAFRAPNFTELYSENNPILTGNSDLKPEKIQTYEAGLEYRFLKNFSAGLNYFHNEIKDMIVTGPKPLGGPADFINADGTTKTDGIEAELDFYFAKNSHGYINCSYQDGEDRNGNDLANAAHWVANAGYNQGLGKYFNANLNISWIGKRPRAAGDTRDDLSSSTLADLTFIAKNFWKGFEIRGSVYNLFDEDYRDPLDTRVPNDLPNQKRMFLAEIRYKF